MARVWLLNDWWTHAYISRSDGSLCVGVEGVYDQFVYFIIYIYIYIYIISYLEYSDMYCFVFVVMACLFAMNEIIDYFVTSGCVYALESSLHEQIYTNIHAYTHKHT